MKNQVARREEGKQWFAVTADNGFAYTDNVALISTFLEVWVKPTVMPMPNKEEALRYSVQAYLARFYSRNYAYGFIPKLPINLLPDVPFVDPEYGNREGRRGGNPPFPGLPV